jgi:hypothetical protein
MIMPAIAKPRPPSFVCFIRFKAITPRMIPAIDPIPQHTHPTADETSEKIANLFVPLLPVAPRGGGG